MRAIHVWWSKPNLLKYNINADQFFVEDYMLLNMILSALYWKKYNGTIDLYTDSTTIQYFEKIGFNALTVWDNVYLDLDEFNADFNPKIFWAAAKIYIMSRQTTPFVSLDTDLHITRQLDDYEEDFVFTHYEDITYPVYPDPKLFLDDYNEVGIATDWTNFAINAAFLLFNNLDFLYEYTSLSLKFIQNPKYNIEHDYDDRVVKMVFAEQRLLGEMLAYHDEITYTSLIDDVYVMNDLKGPVFAPYLNKSNVKSVTKYFFHLWGHKQSIQNDKKAYEKYMNNMFDKVKKDFLTLFDDIKIICANAYVTTNNSIYERHSRLVE